MRRSKPRLFGRSGTRLLLLLVALALAAHRYFAQTGMSPRPSPGPALAACGEAEDCFAGSVTRVIDGDTLDVGGTRIRLVLVDAPERDTREGPAATRHLEELCPVGSEAQVYRDRLQPTDEYGRTLAVVWCGGKRVNEEMIRSGHAQLYGRFCRKSVFGIEPWAIELGCR
jgi:endonuclease YncB( thermonuclease family)